MAEGTLMTPDENGKKEKKKPFLVDEKPLRIEPKKVEEVQKSTSPAAEPEKPIEISPREAIKKPIEASPRETVIKKEKKFISPKLAETKLGAPLKTEGKSSPLFRVLFVLSLIFVGVTIGLLLLPIFRSSIPTFLTPLIHFADKLL